MNDDDNSNRNGLYGCLAIIGGVVLLFTFVVFLASTARVDKGEVAITNWQGKVDTSQQPLGPGWHPIMPFFQGYDSVSVVQQSHAFRKVSTGAQNQQTVYIDGTVSYHVDSAKAATLVIQGGSDQLINRLLWPAFQDFIKEEIPRYADYRAVLNNRPEIRKNVTAALQGKTDQYGLFVDDIFLTDIEPEDSYKASINNGAKAQQDLVTAQNEAKAKVAAAQGEADANRIRQQTITDQVLKQQELNNQAAAINKWKGDMPNTLIVNGNGSDPISLIFNGGSVTK